MIEGKFKIICDNCKKSESLDGVNNYQAKSEAIIKGWIFMLHDNVQFCTDECCNKYFKRKK